MTTNGTNDERFRCDVCGERYESQDELRKHWLEAHEDREAVDASAGVS
jgi:hypothetical protein